MVRGIPELDASVRSALEPTWAEIVRAKKAIRELLADGRPHGIRTIQSCLLVSDGIALEPVRGERLQLGSADDIDSVVTTTQPLISRPRLALAATDALLDLAAQGIVIEVADAPGGDGQPIVGPGMVSVPYQLGGTSSAVRSVAPLPRLASAYRLAPRLREQATHWFSDPDLFTADLQQLRLDRRTLKSLDEALGAYRQGLFLACASLLGATSEGAWYAAGEQLRDFDDQLAKALDADNTAKVITRVAEVLRQVGRNKATVDELHAQAALLRQLRNYGVHPRGDKLDHLERYFTDAGAVVLLMETYTYLTRLTVAVEARLSPAGGAGDGKVP